MSALTRVNEQGRWWSGRRRHENRRTVSHPHLASHHIRWRQALGMVILIVGLSSGLPWAWTSVGQYITQHPYFTISEIVIETETPFSEEDIRRWSGLTTNTNLWTVNAAQIGEQLMAHPGIRTATVEREFPQRVRIAVTARKPIAVVVHEAVTFIDETGAVFAHEQAYPLDLPFVSGLAGIPLDTPEARTAIAGVLPLLSLTRLWPERLSEIHWDAQQGYTVFLTQRQVSVRLGWEVTPEKFTQVGAVLAHWPTSGPAVLFDARFADQVVVRPDTEILGQTAFHPTQPL